MENAFKAKRFKVKGTLSCGMNQLQSFNALLTIIIEILPMEVTICTLAIKLYLPGFTLKVIV